MSSLTTGSASMTRYDLFGRRVAVACGPGAEPLGAFIERRWRAFADGLRDDAAVTAADVVFRLAQRDAGRLREWQFFNNGRLLVIADDRRLITGLFHRQPWEISIEAFGRTVDDAYYYLFEPVLLMALARLNLVHWHGAAVRRDSAAVLVVGPSGSGKSTTTLTLLEAGYAFVADDEVFLEPRDEGVAVRGVDREVYATDGTLAMFPRLDGLKAAPLVRRGHGMKRAVPVRDLYGGVPDDAAPAVARVVILPTVSADGVTRIRPLPASEAVYRFLGEKPKEYPTFVTDEAAAQRRLEGCVALARTARCLEVTLGRDAASLPERMEEYLR